jgi:orotate phosphoribosyltransferase
VQQQYQIPVLAIANLDDLLTYLQSHPNMEQYAPAVTQYRLTYGANTL